MLVSNGMALRQLLAIGCIAALVALSVIDIEEQLLPDAVLAPLFSSASHFICCTPAA